MVVIMSVAAVTLRTLELYKSARYKLPESSNAIPDGASISASVAGPLSPPNPGFPVPIAIIKSPDVFISLTVFAVSYTHLYPKEKLF